MLQRRQDPFHWFYRPNDVFILDRGFRDALEELESVGYLAKVPISSATRGAQLSTGDANKSRMVTMCRWVVETINGRLKNQFKLLRNIANNLDTYLKKLK
ncbi:Uncharacterized protein OBRU01_15210 [Operophtera brumata]|uniref:DDE Tnp4 domain-containing protein n=1 Tax=Operophtera brumata TaxID=104452 RepID=A0A0L7L5D1_OPEBR|nr:Uncharacterized protein OBRU01_15210 [Operophtera brumata]